MYLGVTGMRKDVYINKDIYKRINDIAESNNTEQMMVFGGKTIGNTVVVDTNSFVHFDDTVVTSSTRESIDVPVYEIELQMYNNYKRRNDTFFMVHSHKPTISFLEFAHGDLSDEDEEISEKLRDISRKYCMDYFDGITTGKKLYFWSTEEKNKPRLMECFIENEKVDYSLITTFSEDIEHLFR